MARKIKLVVREKNSSSWLEKGIGNILIKELGNNNVNESCQVSAFLC